MNKSFLKVITLVVAISSGIGFSSSSVLSDDLKVALAAEPTSMDPHYQNLTINNSFSTQVYNALVLQDVNQNLLPGLAKSWKPIDELTWEFKLRPGVKFHNGAAFTSEDVVATMKRAANVPNSPSSFATFIKGKKFDVVDELTIRVSTKKPNPFIPNDMSRIAIIDSGFANATTEDFNTGVASFGTGPFKFSKWLPGDLIEIKRNNDYWGSKVKWNKIIIRPIKDGTTRTAALISGDVDLLNEFHHLIYLI
jgi:peptide/nickel transport system substrate-binding protein